MSTRKPPPLIAAGLLQTQLSTAEDDPEITQLIGVIVVRWATLDINLLEVLSFVLKNKEAAEIIYFSLGNFKARLDIITNLVLELWPKEDEARKAHILNLLNRVNRLSGTRNDIVHSRMHQTDGQPEHFRVVRKPGRKVPHAILPVKNEDLRQHADVLSEISLSFIVAMHRWAYEALAKSLDALPSTPDAPLPDRSRRSPKKPRAPKTKPSRPPQA